MNHKEKLFFILDRNVGENICKDSSSHDIFFDRYCKNKKVELIIPPLLCLEYLGFNFRSIELIQINPQRCQIIEKQLKDSDKSKYHEILLPLYNEVLTQAQDKLQNNNFLKKDNLNTLVQNRKREFTTSIGKALISSIENIVNNDSFEETIRDILSIGLLVSAQTNRYIAKFYEANLLEQLSIHLTYDLQVYFTKIINHFVDGFTNSNISIFNFKSYLQQYKIKEFTSKNKNWRLRPKDDNFDAELLHVFFHGIDADLDNQIIFTKDTSEIIQFRLSIYKLLVNTINSKRVAGNQEALNYYKNSRIIIIDSNQQILDQIDFNNFEKSSFFKKIRSFIKK